MSETTPEPLEVEAAPVVQTESLTHDPGMLAVKSYFELKNPTTQDQEKLKEIWEYVSKDAKYPGEASYQLRQLENRLSSPRLGESRLNKIYEYIRLSNVIDRSEKERNEL